MAFRHEILDRIVHGRIVAIVRKLTPEDTLTLARILVDEGISAVEITLNSPAALEGIAGLRRQAGGAAVVGAGTVLDGASAVQAILAGADFLVSPNLRADVIQAAHRHGKPVFPGAMTPTEIAAAAEAGADMIKVFPAGTLGPGFFKDLSGPLGHLPLMATGGIGPDNARDFIAQGVAALGVGGSLTKAELVRAGKWDEIRGVARSVMAAVQPR